MPALAQRLLHDARVSLASPSRNARTAVVLGRLLGIAFLVCFATGIYSHLIQEPPPWMRFPTRPVWLYQVSQGVHITAGLLCFPLILGKLHAVYPRLFETPPVRSFAHLLERASIALFVAVSLVQITIGLLNTFQFYSLFPFPFRQVHFALSFVLIGLLAVHIGVKLRVIADNWRRIDAERTEADGDGSDASAAEPPRVSTGGVTGRLFSWVDRTPRAEPRASRRGFLAAIAATSAVLVATTAGQSFRPLDALNVFAPRKNGVGPTGLPVNRTARAAGVLETATAASWALTVVNGDASRSFTRAELARLPQHEVVLPIACVEGWSQYARWRGPRLRDLADAVGADSGASLRARSLEQDSIYAVTEIGPEFVRDELTLVALELEGVELDIDHGYPARLIAPARPGVLQTKWLDRIEVIR